MAFAILGNPKPAFFDSSGAPLVNGTLSVLDPADDTNKASYPTYDDAEALTNANANPITLDSRGECDLWGRDGEDYKLVLKDATGNTIWTTDDVYLPGTLTTTSIEAFTDGDTTPSVLSTEPTTVFKTANTGATTITDFDDGYNSQVIYVVIDDANTTIDFSASGLTGNGGADWSPASGDAMTCIYDGTDWFCIISTPVAVVAANVDSGASTDGQVLTSDGAGNSAWEDIVVGVIDAESSTDGQVLTSDGASGAAWEDIVVGVIDAEASTDGQVLTSDGAGNAAWEDVPTSSVNGCKVHDASSQSITTTTWTAINFDSEAYDTNSFHSTVSNISRITIPSGVTRVRFTGHVEFPTNGSGIRRIKIRKNGSDGAIDDAMSTYQPFEYRSASGASGVPISMGIDSGIITVAQNDYFQLLCYQTSATTLAIPARDSWFQIEVIE